MKNFPERDATASTGPTVRCLVVGILLIIANSYWLTEATWRGRQESTYISLFINTVFCLFVLTLLNLLLKRTWPRAAFHESELLVIYVMILMLSTLYGNTNMGYLVYTLACPFRSATA